MFPSICLAQEGRSQRHFRASSEGQELRACVGLKEAYCCLPPSRDCPFFLGEDVTPKYWIGGKRWLRICALDSGWG